MAASETFVDKIWNIDGDTTLAAGANIVIRSAPASAADRNAIGELFVNVNAPGDPGDLVRVEDEDGNPLISVNSNIRGQGIGTRAVNLDQSELPLGLPALMRFTREPGKSIRIRNTSGTQSVDVEWGGMGIEARIKGTFTTQVPS